MQEPHCAWSQSSMFPADLGVKMRSRPIMWICYWLLCTVNLNNILLEIFKDRKYTLNTFVNDKQLKTIKVFFLDALRSFMQTWHLQTPGNFFCKALSERPKCSIVWLHFETWRHARDQEGSCWDRRSEQAKEMVAPLGVLLSKQFYHMLWQAFWQWAPSLLFFSS